MYKLEWKKYLADGRFRKTLSTDASKRDEYDNRNSFESDLGRVIFCSASRRMHDKTQVIPLTTDDNVHSRLIHSLEVMNLCYSFGIRLCRTPEFIRTYGEKKVNELIWKICPILETAGLIHDIGNPPFGHFGEVIIQQYFKKYFENIDSFFTDKEISESEKEDLITEKLDFTQFDGNAQGFRVVTKLQFLNDTFGLNLTYATLAASLKYPNVDEKGREADKIAYKKHGVFKVEEDRLNEIAQRCNLKINRVYHRHPLSFLVEAADSICYLIMDIEDGYGRNWYTFDDIENDLYRNKKINEIIKKIKESSEETIPEQKKIVDFRINIIDYLAQTAIKNFIFNLKEIDNGNYNFELILDDSNDVALDLAKFEKKHVLARREIQSLELTGNSVITGLLNIYLNLVFNKERAFRDRAKTMISKAILLTAINEWQPSIRSNIDLQDFDIKDLPARNKIRMIVDYISGMTDKFALKHYQKLSGQRIA